MKRLPRSTVAFAGGFVLLHFSAAREYAGVEATFAGVDVYGEQNIRSPQNLRRGIAGFLPPPLQSRRLAVCGTFSVICPPPTVWNPTCIIKPPTLSTHYIRYEGCETEDPVASVCCAADNAAQVAAADIVQEEVEKLKSCVQASPGFLFDVAKCTADQLENNLLALEKCVQDLEGCAATAIQRILPDMDTTLCETNEMKAAFTQGELLSSVEDDYNAIYGPRVWDSNSAKIAATIAFGPPGVGVDQLIHLIKDQAAELFKAIEEALYDLGETVITDLKQVVTGMFMNLLLHGDTSFPPPGLRTALDLKLQIKRVSCTKEITVPGSEEILAIMDSEGYFQWAFGFRIKGSPPVRITDDQVPVPLQLTNNSAALVWLYGPPDAPTGVRYKSDLDIYENKFVSARSTVGNPAMIFLVKDGSRTWVQSTCGLGCDSTGGRDPCGTADSITLDESTLDLIPLSITNDAINCFKERYNGKFIKMDGSLTIHLVQDGQRRPIISDCTMACTATLSRSPCGDVETVSVGLMNAFSIGANIDCIWEKYSGKFISAPGTSTIATALADVIPAALTGRRWRTRRRWIGSLWRPHRKSTASRSATTASSSKWTAAPPSTWCKTDSGGRSSATAQWHARPLFPAALAATSKL
ncbi:unnamed protein product [Phaeothamnion confervicola]